MHLKTAFLPTGRPDLVFIDMSLLDKLLGKLLSSILPHSRGCIKEEPLCNSPAALPHTRSRAFTLPSDITNPQLASPFFRLLPAELRTRIYELVLADGGLQEGRELHLASMKKARLACIRCFEGSPSAWAFNNSLAAEKLGPPAFFAEMSRLPAGIHDPLGSRKPVGRDHICWFPAWPRDGTHVGRRKSQPADSYLPPEPSLLSILLACRRS